MGGHGPGLAGPVSEPSGAVARKMPMQWEGGSEGAEFGGDFS